MGRYRGGHPMSTQITGTLVWYYAICPREAWLMAHEVVKVLKIGREYLDHILNSVREGELSPAQYKKLKHEVGEAITPSSIACASTCCAPRSIWTLRSWGSLLVRATPGPSCKSTWSSMQTPIVRQKQRRSCKWHKIPSNGSQKPLKTSTIHSCRITCKTLYLWLVRSLPTRI